MRWQSDRTGFEAVKKMGVLVCHKQLHGAGLVCRWSQDRLGQLPMQTGQYHSQECLFTSQQMCVRFRFISQCFTLLLTQFFCIYFSCQLQINEFSCTHIGQLFTYHNHFKVKTILNQNHSITIILWWSNLTNYRY